MPLILKEKNPKYGNCVLWSPSEEKDFFIDQLSQTGLDIQDISPWHPKRQKEWLTARYLIHRFIHEDVASMTLNEYGKPGFARSSINFSISHTEGVVGVYWDNRPVGIDIQIKTAKIRKVAHKFCSDNDYQYLKKCFDTEDAQWVAWGIKEAVFKAYGRGQLSYKNHIIITDIKTKPSYKESTIELRKENSFFLYQAKIRFLGPFCLCQVYEDQLPS